MTAHRNVRLCGAVLVAVLFANVCSWTAFVTSPGLLSPRRFHLATRQACRQTSEERLVSVSCSRLAGLSGRNPYERSGQHWREIMKTNFYDDYKRLASQDASILTRVDAAYREETALSESQRRALRAVQRRSIAAPDAQRVHDAAKEAVPSLSDTTAAQIARSVNWARGRKAEAPGLSTATVADQKVAIEAKAKVAMLQTTLKKEEQLRDERLAQASSVTETASVEKDFKKKSERIAVDIGGLSKTVAEHSLPMIKGNTKLFSAQVADGLVLTGKIDAQRNLDEHGEVHIIEHKARQRKLFNALRQYEQIQCLGYMDLVQRDFPDNDVRCFLVETFKGTSSRCEVSKEKDFWEDAVLGVVQRRAGELQGLMLGGAPAGEVLAWLDAL